MSANYGAAGTVTYAYDAAGHLITRAAQGPGPVLTIAKTHSGNFTQGQNGAAYSIKVSNTGAGPANGAAQVSDALPAGLTAVSAKGTGWTCNIGPPVGCTRGDSLAAGASYPAITLTVNVAADAPASVTNTASISGTGISANDPTIIVPTGGTPLSTAGLYFIPVTQCHLVDTRPNQLPAGSVDPRGIMQGQETRTFIPASGACGIPATAKAYSFTVTARPTNVMPYLTIFPTGQPQPNVSTLNAFAGGTVSNSAIVPAGAGGGVDVFVTDQADVALDINGYFDDALSSAATAFYTLPPCRILDTRKPSGIPAIAAGGTLDFAIASNPCVPAQARAAAYSLNVTVVPQGPLDYVEVWPSNSPQPQSVITLGSPSGQFGADAAIVQTSAGGSVSVYASNPTDIVLDTNGYFGAPGGSGALLFHSVTPCRVADTRDPTIRPLGGPAMTGDSQRTFPVGTSSCKIPLGVQAYSLNVTVSPPAPLSFLTLWPTGLSKPFVSTVNDILGIILANAAIVPVGKNDSVDVYVYQASNVILDINGYFSKQQSGDLKT